MRSLLTLFTCFVVVALTSLGCVRQSLSHQALTFNRTVHDHRVEQLLLNVLRASNREPMALTAVTSLSTSNNRKLNIGPVAGNFGYQSTDLYTGVLSGGVSASPNMAITILDDDPEFMAGFAKPVSEKEIRYFVQQGWSPELLSYLLIEEIRDSKLGNLRNDPRDPVGFQKFVQVLEENLGKLEVIDEVRRDRPKKVTTTSTKLSEDQQRTEVITEESSSGIERRGGLYIAGSEATIVMRSPQSVLYYLGELARIQLDGGTDGVVPAIRAGSGTEPVFLVERCGKSIGSSSGQVAYRGGFYRIPSSPQNRSMQSLAFVQQLINLQSKKIADAPSTLRLLSP